MDNSWIVENAHGSKTHAAQHLGGTCNSRFSFLVTDLRGTNRSQQRGEFALAFGRESALLDADSDCHKTPIPSVLEFCSGGHPFLNTLTVDEHARAHDRTVYII